MEDHHLLVILHAFEYAMSNIVCYLGDALSGVLFGIQLSSGHQVFPVFRCGVPAVLLPFKMNCAGNAQHCRLRKHWSPLTLGSNAVYPKSKCSVSVT